MSIQYIREAMSEIMEKNNQICCDKINKMTEVLEPFFDEARSTERQDEWIFVYIYYRKWNDIATHWLASWLRHNCEYYDQSMIDKSFKNWSNNNFEAE